MRRIFLLLLIFTSLNALSWDYSKKLFLNPVVQDSLKMFIENNKQPLENPYGAPTLYLVTIEQRTPNDTTITFMSSFSLIEEVSLDSTTEPSLYIKGGCQQYGKTIVLFYSNIVELPMLVDESILTLKEKDYDFFRSYKGPIYDIKNRCAYHVYRYKCGQLQLIYRYGDKQR